MSSGSSDSNSSGSTIEIKLVSFDSQTYTLQVDKHVPLPTLGEQIATVTHVLPENQILVLDSLARSAMIHMTDNELLSDYNVEDGDTLTLIMLNLSVRDSMAEIIEIKIKTLDSQTYTLRVNKHVRVTALKELVAVVTGVLSEQQRLISRGEVLKDDQLLSAYHVEDGQTLHLVMRQPIPPSSSVSGDGNNSQTAGAHGSGGVQQDSDAASHLLAGSGGLRTNREEMMSAMVQALTHVVGSASERVSSDHDATRGLFDFYSVSAGSWQPLDQSGMRRRSSANVRGNRNSSSQTAGAHASGGVQEDPDAASRLPVGRRGPPTPAPSAGFWNSASQGFNNLLDSFNGLTSGWHSSDQTATEDSSGMRRRSSANGSGGESSQTAGIRVRGGVHEDSDGPSRLPAGRGLFETPPSSWAEILPFIKDKLSEYAGGIGQLMGLLHDHLNLTDPVAWRTIEVNAMQLHDLLKNFAIVLLETSRTIMTLPMGRLPPWVSPNRGNSSRERPRATPNRGNSSRGQRGPDNPASSSSSRVHID